MFGRPVGRPKTVAPASSPTPLETKTVKTAEVEKMVKAEIVDRKEIATDRVEIPPKEDDPPGGLKEITPEEYAKMPISGLLTIPIMLPKGLIEDIDDAIGQGGFVAGRSEVVAAALRAYLWDKTI